MNKNLYYEIYSGLARQLRYDDDRLSQRKMLHTRMFKLSATKSHYSSAEIGRVLFESEQFQKSLVQLKRATIIDSKDSDTQVSLAEAFLKLDKENEAFSYLKKALCLSPGSYCAHSVVIRRFQEQKRLGDIESFYQEIANTLTDMKSLADLYFGSAESLVGLNQYSKAFEAHPMRSRHHYSYAVALYHEGFFEEAIVQFEHASEKDPRDKLSMNNIAHLHYCLGRLQTAFEEFEYIIANGLESDGTYSNFILVLYHLDKDEEVINRYRDLLQQNLGGNGPMLQLMYKESLRITRVLLDRDNIDEETREFNLKKIRGLNLVLSFLNTEQV